MALAGTETVSPSFAAATAPRRVQPLVLGHKDDPSPVLVTVIVCTARAVPAGISAKATTAQPSASPLRLDSHPPNASTAAAYTSRAREHSVFGGLLLSTRKGASR